MALDTYSKRLAANLVGLPFRSSYPIPDGTLDAADRLHVAYLPSIAPDADQSSAENACLVTLAITDPQPYYVTVTPEGPHFVTVTRC